MARTDDDILEGDRLPGLPHPRERRELFGHLEAARAFRAAFELGRLHHAWLIGGPEGIGKATFAYRAARFLLAAPGSRAPEGGADPLGIDAEDPVARQVSALSHPDFVALRRLAAPGAKSLPTTISVNAIRDAMTLFETRAAGGYRVAVIDCAEDLAAAGANALLKILEEPPPRSVFLIVSHQPRAVMATIRSRCAKLALSPLGDDEMAATLRSLGPPYDTVEDASLHAVLPFAEGSVRRAIAALDQTDAKLLDDLTAILAGLPRFDRRRVAAIGEGLARRDGERAFWLVVEEIERHLERLVAANAEAGPRRLAPLAALCDKLRAAAREVDVYNLDRRPFIAAMFADLSTVLHRAGDLRAPDGAARA